MTITITPNPAKLIVPPESFTSYWDYTDETIGGGAGVPYDLNDASVYDEIGTEVTRRGPMIQQPLTDPPITYESLNPAIATVDADGNVESIATGSTTIICRKRHIKNKVAISALFESAQNATYLVNYLAGTLGKYAYDAADALLDVSVQTNVYSSGTTRNPNVWTGAYDLTGIMQQNTTGGSTGRRGATLISPRHVYMAKHYPVAVGATITWVAADNTLVQRTLTAVESVPNVLYEGNISGDIYYASPDIQIGLLNSDVPGTIKHYKILPVNWREYLTTYTNSEIPIIVGAQQGRIYQRWWKYADNAIRYGVPEGQEIAGIRHVLADRASAEIIVGDSGQPLFLPVNSELVLLACHYSSGGAAFTVAFKAEIDTVMTSLGGGYTTTSVDLSGFNYYG